MGNGKKDVYNFKQYKTNICPDCGGFVDWNSYHQQFICLSNDCAFIADKNGQRVWDNNMRAENIERMQAANNFEMER